MEPLEILPGRYIGEGYPCLMVAEIGQNHQGDVKIAKQLIISAKEAGADCIKLQASCLESKFTSAALERPYDSPNAFGSTYGEHKKHLQLTDQQVRNLFEYAKEIDIPITASVMDMPVWTKFLFEYANEIDIPITASVMDMTSLEFIASMNPPFIKIGSGDVHNLPLVRKAAKFGLPLVISTGMCDIAWITEIYKDICINTPHTPLVLLQCTSAYPVPSAQIHLRVMDTYAQIFPKAHIGYSGHEIGIHVSIAAVARGAKLLERHFTLNKEWKGSDHACSLEPMEFKQLVSAVRNVEFALGSPLKDMQPSEEDCYKKLGKSVVATRDIEIGEILNEDHLVAKVAEPSGIPAKNLLSLVGRTAVNKIRSDEAITQDMLSA